MSIKDWKYYNHAVVPSILPYENVDIEPICDGTIWKLSGGGWKIPILARWTTNFDCGYETNWWYVVKDMPFDIASLKAKRRYEINKGIKNFDVKLINPCEYKEELYCIQVAAFSAYPEKYRPSVDKESFMNDIEGWKNFIVFGAFFRESKEIVGYAFLSKRSNDFIDFSVLKTKPEYEKYSINAALVEKIMTHFANFLENGGMICDGARSINHETNFQDYLEKYFGFRKAYCQLYIKYNPKIEWLVKILYPVREFLKKLDGIKIVHQVNAVLKMEEIYRNEV